MSLAEQRRLPKAFIAADRKADLAALEGLCASDVVSYSDGGGVVRAARARLPVASVSRSSFTAFASHFWTGVTLTWIQTNGQSSVLIARDGAIVAVATIDASAEGINQILWMMRPSKLTAISKPEQTNGGVSAITG